MTKLMAKYGKYYDLIKLPHGHVPAPLIKLWSVLPLPVKAIRDECYYFCPECGEPSFFKINYVCWQCQDDYSYPPQNLGVWIRYQQRKRRKYFRGFLKKIEYLILPILVLIGKAYYVESKRSHFLDKWKNIYM